MMKIDLVDIEPDIQKTLCKNFNLYGSFFSLVDLFSSGTHEIA
jgi:hypothetical protein